ncbi:unnamed protein product [Schistosoma curassoni]|uniref:FERM domain-containing protein n=1 Tax=Schistosoma curassoni TaxID=6186 RepID=A0A183JWL3_9TREM|nr:unnamed protein product [Schistosoma curassoni]
MHGMQWTAWMQLGDLDFTDGLALLSHARQQMQVKTTNVAAASESVDLNIHKGKIKIHKYNTESTKPITFNCKTLEEVESFKYLYSITNERGESDADVKPHSYS